MSFYSNDYSLTSGYVNREDGIFPSYYNGQRFIKDTVKRVIETLLKDIPPYKFYPQSSDYKQNVFVTVSNPYEQAQFPSIVVDTAPGQNIIGDYQNFIRDLTNELGEILGERYGGINEYNLEVKIYAKSTQERDELADIVSFGLFQVKRRSLESQGIVVQQPSVSGEGEEVIGTDKIYSLTLNFKIYSHWIYDVLFENIENIRIDIDTDSPDNPGGQSEIPYDETIILDENIFIEPTLAEIPGASGCGPTLSVGSCCNICGKKQTNGPHPDSRYAQIAKGEGTCNCG